MMNKSIENYLELLKKELSTSDPAVVQDALSDAEDHLRTALEQALKKNPDIPEEEALQPILDEYGAPAEIASAYREIETRMPPPLATHVKPNGRSWAAKFFGVMADPRAYAALLYLFFSLGSGIIYFTWAVTGLSISAALIVLVIGVPFFCLFLLSVQGIALVEGRLVEALLGIRMPRRPLFYKSHLSLWGRAKALFTDKRSWTTIIYMIIQLPLGIIYFTIFITMLCIGLYGIASPIMENTFGIPFMQINELEIFLSPWMMPLAVVVGVLWILLTMHLARVVGQLHGRYAKVLLVRD
jgi:hypothetical protein